MSILTWLRVLGLSVVVSAVVLIVPGRTQPAGEKKAAKKSGEEITNSIGMKLVSIKPGKFTMGSPASEKGRTTGEFAHEVEITRGFFMGAFEVTQEEYEKVMGKNPSWFAAGGEGKKEVAGLNTRRFPVEQVSWEDAMAFCKELGKKEGKTYDLPTEAEWEYACRAGTTTPFHFGGILNGRQANHDGSEPYGTDEKGPSLGRTCAVGSYSANKFGLYDMHGNVWEWCKDWYGLFYYEDSSPPRDPQGPDTGKFRVVRGGAFNDGRDGGWYCRSACRAPHRPGERFPDTGFRVVLRSP
jgi:formylglycine-generating enzyme required for sulfatase activity